MCKSCQFLTLLSAKTLQRILLFHLSEACQECLTRFRAVNVTLNPPSQAFSIQVQNNISQNFPLLDWRIRVKNEWVLQHHEYYIQFPLNELMTILTFLISGLCSLYIFRCIICRNKNGLRFWCTVFSWWIWSNSSRSKFSFWGIKLNSHIIQNVTTGNICTKNK